MKTATSNNRIESHLTDKPWPKSKRKPSETKAQAEQLMATARQEGIGLGSEGTV